MEKKNLRDVKVDTQVKIPIDDLGFFTYDYGGKLLAKKQYITATVIDLCVIAWDDKQTIKVNNRPSNIKDSGYDTKYPNLKHYISLSGGVPCLEMKFKQKPSAKFLFAALGTGVTMNSLIKMAGSKASISKIEEMST